MNVFQWAKKQLYVILMGFLKNVLGVDIHQHLSNPGSGIGKWFVTKVFKNNNPATDKLLSMLTFPEHAQAVEIGFGVGDSLKTALGIAPRTAVFKGYELSQSMLQEATRNLQGETRVELSLRDCAKDGIPCESETLDVVYHANVLYFVPDPVLFLKECCRVLKPNGQLGMNVVQPTELTDLSSDSPFKHLFSESELVDVCKRAGFSKVEVTHVADVMARMLIVAIKE